MSNFDIDWKTIGELYIQPVTDPDGNPLGWAVCVLIEDGQQAEFLVLRHHTYSSEAFAANQGMLNFRQTRRSKLAKLASIREMWEWIAEVPDGSEICWTVIEGTDLTAFRNGQYLLCYSAKDWHPNGPSSISRWIEKYSKSHGQ